jgi:hypothetical protein
MEAFKYNESSLLTNFFHHYLKALPEMCGVDWLALEPMPAEAH